MANSLQVVAQNTGSWRLDEFSEDVEFQRQQVGPRLYRHRLRCTVSRTLDGVSAVQGDGNLQSAFPSETAIPDILGASVFPVRDSALSQLGTSSVRYGGVALVSARAMQAGPDGSQALRQVAVFEATTGFQEYPYDAEFEE